MPPKIMIALVTLLDYIIEDPAKAKKDSFHLLRGIAMKYIIDLSLLDQHTWWLDLLVQARNTLKVAMGSSDEDE